MVYCSLSIIIKKMASQLSSKGEISTEAVPCVCVEWKVPYIHLLPQNTDHEIYSPSFHFKDVAWYLRLKIHGQKRRVPYDDWSYDWIGLHLVKKDTAPSTLFVNYHIGIKAVSGNTYSGDYNFISNYSAKDCWGTSRLICRSKLSEAKTRIAPNGVVIFFCYFWVEPGVSSYVLSGKDPFDDQPEMIDSENIDEISAYIAAAITYVEWKVPDIHLLAEDTVHRIRSSSFQFKDETWCLEVTIHDTEFKHGGTWGPIDLHVLRMDCAIPMLDVDSKVGIKSSDGSTYRTRRDILTFDSDAESHEWIDLVSRLDKKIIEAPNGEVTFFSYFRLDIAGDFDVYSPANMSEDQDESEEKCSESEEASKDEDCKDVDLKQKLQKLAGLEKLGTDLKNLFISGEDSDVTIKVKNKEFKAHKNILRARSTVFHSMFTHDMAEKNSGTVDIADCDPDAFEIFLLYLYNGKMDNLSTNTVFDLYKAADKYDSKELKLQCKDFMLSNFSVDTVCDVIEHALQYDEAELLKTATEFFAKNLKNVILTVKWQSLLKSNPVATNELLIKATNYYVLKE